MTVLPNTPNPRKAEGEAAAPAKPSRPLRVLFVGLAFPRPGAELLGSWALARLRALQAAGAEVRVISPSPLLPGFLARRTRLVPDRRRLRIEGIDAFYPSWPVYLTGSDTVLRRLAWANPSLEVSAGWRFLKKALRREVADFRPDVIYGQNAWLAGDLARRLAEEEGLPLVLTEHDLDDVATAGDTPRRRRHYGRAFAAARHVVVTSRRMADAVARLAAPGRVQTLYNGVSVAETDREVSADTPPSPPKRVLAVGGFYPRKAYPLLIRAFARVAPRHEELTLEIIGDGEDRPAIEAAVAETGLGDRVRLLGARPNAEVRRRMAEADVFALPSWSEGFGNVYLEAMSAGTPVLCCADSGIAEIVEDGRTAMICRPKDEDDVAAKLGALLDDDALRRDMAVRGQRLVWDEHSWAAHGRRLHALLADAAR